MVAAPLPDNEEQRLKALFEYDVLDTASEQIFDTIADIASSICATPFAAISFIDENRQWFKSFKGSSISQIDRADAFCAYTILGEHLVEVENAANDERFKDAALVQHAPHLVYYAGVPLKNNDGYHIGTICVYDQEPKQLTKRQANLLNELADIVVALLESRKNLAKDHVEIENQIATLSALNIDLEKKLMQEKELAHMFKIFNQMYSMLQSCRTTKEALVIIRKYCQLMFPYVSGSLYLANNGTTYFDLAITWKAPHSKKECISSESCWSLRRGQPYFSTIDDGLVCEHFNAEDDLSPYMCAPLISHGETIGMLCIEYTAMSAIADDMFMDVQRSFAMRMAEHIALALSNIKLRRRLRDQSVRDPLTNLYNRRYLYDYFKKEVAHLVSQQLYPGLMIIDIDYFKKINDTYGHHVGDEVLKQVSDRLMQMVSKHEVVSRIGGEEFVFICFGNKDEEIIARAKEVFETVNNLQPDIVGVEMPPISFSVGLGIYYRNGEEISNLLSAADKALYDAKEKGRSQLIVQAAD